MKLDKTMRLLVFALVLGTVFVIAGCYPAGHEYHDEETHQQELNKKSQADDPNRDDVYWWGKNPPP